ncbi:hypothetical protein PsYK624_062550 [Phanerochaete sordida]|uniref:Uncharacterized protein n=1 Tax=Phanerochaete sordida TaxID=48140 RepID=A0A9P3LC45_9APHY|nr:hypothetical protein PsYK624_062550 [Phanerochaete sordida]
MWLGSVYSIAPGEVPRAHIRTISAQHPPLQLAAPPTTAAALSRWMPCRVRAAFGSRSGPRRFLSLRSIGPPKTYAILGRVAPLSGKRSRCGARFHTRPVNLKLKIKAHVDVDWRIHAVLSFSNRNHLREVADVSILMERSAGKSLFAGGRAMGFPLVWVSQATA